jgi:predicted ATPase
MKDAGRLAQELDRADDMTAWLTLAARLYSLLREPASMEEHATRAIALAAEHRFSFFLGYATILKGWAVSEQGHSQEGIALMNEGMELRRSTGTVLHQAYFDAVLAERYASAGQDEVGLSRFNDAFARLRSTGERWCEAELYRMNGALLLRQPKPEVSQAEALLNQALSVARSQQAKAWELRAATELACLRQSQGRNDDGYAVLAPVYASFDEGFGTTDLRVARTLLTRLSTRN